MLGGPPRAVNRDPVSHTPARGQDIQVTPRPRRRTTPNRHNPPPRTDRATGRVCRGGVVGVALGIGRPPPITRDASFDEHRGHQDHLPDRRNRPRRQPCRRGGPPPGPPGPGPGARVERHDFPRFPGRREDPRRSRGCRGPPRRRRGSRLGDQLRGQGRRLGAARGIPPTQRRGPEGSCSMPRSRPTSSGSSTSAAWASTKGATTSGPMRPCRPRPTRSTATRAPRTRPRLSPCPTSRNAACP